MLEILYFLTIRPLEIIFETIFFICYGYIGKPFPTIIALSVFVNILVFPLYRRSDKLQAVQREREKAMEEKIAHIKKTFKGDERVMMTQAYYRICDYKPVYALRGASSLLLQIPFFIAAFRFLSGLELLKGMPSILLSLPWKESPTYLIDDLGSPDGMLRLGAFSINLLPILMTLINIISGTIYSKGHPRKEKIQLYVTALVFLALLYNSPSGLVIYWTCNNIFSLCKNAVQKLMESKKTSTGLAKPDDIPDSSMKVYNRIFIFCAILLALMTGLFIPSNVVSSSAFDFFELRNVYNPSKFFIATFSLGIGLFVIWIGIYYVFMSPKGKLLFSKIMAAVCVSAVINYMMSGSGLGTLSVYLKYDEAPSFEISKIIINIILITASSVAVILLSSKKPVVVSSLAIAGCVSLLIVSFGNINRINNEFDEYVKAYTEPYSEMPRISLSKTGRNVIVILLDRAMGPQLPYMLNERPDLIEKYDGFTFYHNTVSYGQCTNFAMPAVYGGYEYTPYELNKREDESLKDKTNEALRVLPVLFNNNGYGVTVFDPPYANYKVYSDLSIYDDYPEINAYISKRQFVNASNSYLDFTVDRTKRNLFCFGDVKILPMFLQDVFYDDGNYHDSRLVYLKYLNVNRSKIELDTMYQVGIDSEFYLWYSVLENMTQITQITDNEKGEFFMMYNCTTHEPNLLQLPDYKPEMYVDNTAFTVNQYYSAGGIEMKMDDRNAMIHYHVNMAALLRLGEWLDYLKEEGVYDNTRIIITSDHGRAVPWFEDMHFGNNISTLWFTPLLMVKDFDEHGFKSSDDFMTNADACVFAASGDVVEKAENPFTGNPLDGNEKYEDKVRVIISENWQPSNGNKFPSSDWYSVSGSLYDNHNWEYLGYE